MSILSVTLTIFAALGAERHVGTGQTYSTIKSAVAASGSGDTIVVHPKPNGTAYVENGISPKSNTSIVGAPNESMPIVDGSDVNHWENSTFYIDNVSNVVLDGLEIRNGTPANVLIGYNNKAENIVVRNCHVHGTERPDNASNIYLNPAAVDVRIENNIIERGDAPYLDDGGANGIFMARSGSSGQNIYIYNNEIFGTRFGVLIKLPLNDLAYAYIENNYIHDCRQGGVFVHTNHAFVRNNLFVGNKNGARVYEEMAKPYTSVGDVIQHNTFVDNRFSILLNAPGDPEGTGALQTIVQDNLIYNKHAEPSTEFMQFQIWKYRASGDSRTHQTISDYNCYFDSQSSTVIGEYGPKYDLARWRVASPSSDVHSRQVEPKLVGGPSPASIRGYALADDSPCKTGSDGADIGADMRFVGLDSPNAEVSIIAHPASSTVAPGESATFVVAVSGALSVHFQWQQRSGSSWIPISNAVNASYTTNPATLADNGTEFRCVVSNPYHSVTSNTATLSVEAPAEPDGGPDVDIPDSDGGDATPSQGGDATPSQGSDATSSQGGDDGSPKVSGADASWGCSGSLPLMPSAGSVLTVLVLSVSFLRRTAARRQPKRQAKRTDG